MKWAGVGCDPDGSKPLFPKQHIHAHRIGVEHHIRWAPIFPPLIEPRLQFHLLRQPVFHPHVPVVVIAVDGGVLVHPVRHGQPCVVPGVNNIDVGIFTQSQIMHILVERADRQGPKEVAGRHLPAVAVGEPRHRLGNEVRVDVDVIGGHEQGAFEEFESHAPGMAPRVALQGARVIQRIGRVVGLLCHPPVSREPFDDFGGHVIEGIIEIVQVQLGGALESAIRGGQGPIDPWINFFERGLVRCGQPADPQSASPTFESHKPLTKLKIFRDPVGYFILDFGLIDDTDVGQGRLECAAYP